MPLSTRFLKQKAIWWAQGPTDLENRTTFLPPVEVPCRWDGIIKRFIAADGSEKVSQAQVMVDREMTPGDMLMKGTLASLEDQNVAPTAYPNAYKIEATSETPTVKGDDIVRTAIL